MDYPVPVAETRNWRTAALVAAAVAAVELVVLLVVGIAYFAWPYVSTARGQADAKESAARTSPAKGHRREAAGPMHRRSETSVLVLNGNGIPGAADQAATSVHARRYVVTGAANASRSDFARTLVMYRSGWEPEAKRLAKDVGAKRVAPLDGMRPRQLLGANLALVIGRR